MKSVEKYKNYCKLVDEKDGVTRHFFGPLLDKKPHGFGYARVEGGVRLAMFRGFWWEGVFRYGHRLELAVDPQDQTQKYIKIREGSFFDHITLACFQRNFITDNVNNLIIEAEYNSSDYFCVTKSCTGIGNINSHSHKYSNGVRGDFFALLYQGEENCEC